MERAPAAKPHGGVGSGRGGRIALGSFRPTDPHQTDQPYQRHRAASEQRTTPDRCRRSDGRCADDSTHGVSVLERAPRPERHDAQLDSIRDPKAVRDRTGERPRWSHDETHSDQRRRHPRQTCDEQPAEDRKMPMRAHTHEHRGWTICGTVSTGRIPQRRGRTTELRPTAGGHRTSEPRGTAPPNCVERRRTATAGGHRTSEPRGTAPRNCVERRRTAAAGLHTSEPGRPATAEPRRLATGRHVGQQRPRATGQFRSAARSGSKSILPVGSSSSSTIRQPHSSARRPRPSCGPVAMTSSPAPSRTQPRGR